MRVLSPSQIAPIAYGAGFRGRGLTTAVAVALAESGGRPRVNARGQRIPAGSGRSNEAHFGRYDERRLYKAKYNPGRLRHIRAGSAWAPWSTYGNGALPAVS
jgi:hypothetical protein